MNIGARIKKLQNLQLKQKIIKRRDIKMSNFEPISIPKTKKNIESLADMILSMNYPGCYICNHKPIITQCLKCEKEICETHCPNVKENGNLQCINCYKKKVIKK